MMAQAGEFSYKNHTIRILPYEPISGQWIADIKVFSPIPGGDIEQQLFFPEGRFFETREEAHQNGLVLAQRWIDKNR